MALIALMGGALFYAAQFPVKKSQQPVPVAQPALEVVSHPSFTLPDVGGNERDFSEWSGRHRLLNFWATWCAPCRREIPLLKTYQDEQGDDGIQVIGIAVDFPEEVAAYAEDAEFNYPVLVGQEDGMAIAEMSGVEFIGMPFTMIVSRDGEYLGAYIGELHRSHLDDVSNILGRLDNGDFDTETAKKALELL
jgi:thiol-disulfide isomerase/thioredoxin